MRQDYVVLRLSGLTKREELGAARAFGDEVNVDDVTVEKHAALTPSDEPSRRRPCQ